MELVYSIYVLLLLLLTQKRAMLNKTHPEGHESMKHHFSVLTNDKFAIGLQYDDI